MPFDQPDSPRAWLVAGAAFLVGFVVFGVLYSFGVFLPALMRELGGGSAALFSAAGLGFYMTGPVTGYLGDRLGPRRMVALGAVLVGTGLGATALIESVWMGFVTYGGLVGLGAASAYMPALAIVGGWFDKRRTTALGLAAAGTGCGTMLLPPLAAWLIEAFGWRTAIAAIGVGSAVVLAGCAVVVRPPPVARARAGGLRRTVLSVSFATLYLSWVLVTMALFHAFIFLPGAATSLGASPAAAAVLVSVIGGMSILGRAGIGPVAERMSITGLYKLAVAVMAGSFVIWLFAGDYPALAVFAAVLGIGYGVRIALVPGVLIALFGLDNLGAMLGVFFTATGVASLLAPLVAGAVDGRMDVVVLATILAAAGLAVILPLRRAR